MKLTGIIIVLIAEVLLPFQTDFNTKLGKALVSPLYAALICFLVGALVLPIYISFAKEFFSFNAFKSASLLSLLGGGIVGAIFITDTLLALPKLGMAITFGLIVAGQVIVAVLLDHF